MKNIIYAVLLLFFSFAGVKAQDTTTVEAKSEKIGENLDLEAVASIFGESDDLEDFEKRLNDPEAKISNLDLNNDNEVDYLRVVADGEGDTRVVTIQAVIGKDKYQDVATVEVTKDKSQDTKVQVVGDVDIYGPDVIVEPVYVQPPVIIHFFWGPYFRPWHSPYYWGYYPPYYRPWHPYPPHVYRRNVHVHVNVHNRYHRTNVRYNRKPVSVQKPNRNNNVKKPLPKTSIPNNKINKTKPATKVTKPMPKVTKPMPKVPRTRPAPQRSGGGFRRRR